MLLLPPPTTPLSSVTSMDDSQTRDDWVGLVVFGIKVSDPAILLKP